MTNWTETATEAVLKVGDGRGFILDTDPRVIITAAHCLPEMPPATAASNLHERTFPVVGRLDEDQTPLWAEIYFADPVSDIGVLCCPDAQTLSDEAEAFDEVIDNAPAFRVSWAPTVGPAWLLGLDGIWSACVCKSLFRRSRTDHPERLYLRNAKRGLYGGMSGSPIVDAQGWAIGVFSLSGGTGENLDGHTEGGPQASLGDCLPGWLARLAGERPIRYRQQSMDYTLDEFRRLKQEEAEVEAELASGRRSLSAGRGSTGTRSSTSTFALVTGGSAWRGRPETRDCMSND